MTDKTESLRKLAAELKMISAELDKQRFAGWDQNPFGIRDLLYSCACEADRLARSEELSKEEASGKFY